MTDHWQQGAATAARMISTGEISSEALVTAYLDRIAARDEEVGAWIWLDRDLALDQARAADKVLASGHGVGPLHGVPVGNKRFVVERKNGKLKVTAE